jgi:UPF0271 protein
MTSIDLNCDMGEIAAAAVDGSQESMMPHITSVNIACGGHAGDQNMMRLTIEQAQRWGLSIGAHPGYPDRANFGRVELDMRPEDVVQSVYEQICALDEVARQCSAAISHVKAHGALYNQAVSNRELASAISEGAARFSRQIVLVGLAGSAMLEVFRDAGFQVAAEAFADRRYEADGTLRSRKLAGALLNDPAEAANQALRVARDGRVIAADRSELSIQCDTICIHGDTPGAPHIAAAVARALREHGVELRAIGRARQ